MSSFQALRWAFIDPGGMQYHPFSVAHEALGGTQSGLCYLLRALQRRGHTVRLLNKSSELPEHSYFDTRSLSAGELKQLKNFDVIVVVNDIDYLLEQDLSFLRRSVLVFWNHHLAPAITRAQWDALPERCPHVVFISDWQRTSYAHFHDLKAFREIAVLKNAVAPVFTRSQSPLPDKPVLAYTSTPMRGLEVLMAIFPQLRARFPELSLRIFSSFAVYQIPERDDGFAEFYALCRNTPGVDYRGSVPQFELARALSQCHFLAYPCTFPETSCIAALEALAAGCRIVTTARAALPETTAGFARLVPPQDDLQQFARSYFKVLAQELQSWNSLQAQGRRQEQWHYTLKHNTWEQRAGEWEAYAYRILGRLQQGDTGYNA